MGTGNWPSEGSLGAGRQIPNCETASGLESYLGIRESPRDTFWQFVHSSGVPHIRLNRRRIMFSELAVYDWLAKRSVGRAR